MLRCLFSASVVMLHSYASHNLFLSLRNVVITDDVKMLCFLLLLFHILAFYFNIEQARGRVIQPFCKRFPACLKLDTYEVAHALLG